VPSRKVPSYRDPLPGAEGEWLAAFAPVGRTGFVVGVQTRRHLFVDWQRALSAGSPARRAVIFLGTLVALTVAGISFIRRKGKLL